jgi:L-fuconolactonase
MIDAHAHLVTPDIATFTPAPLSGGPLAEGALANHMTFEALVAAMDRLGVAKAVAVQRAHVYGYDNSYVLHAARQVPNRLAAVACIDAQAPDSDRTAEALIAAGAVGLRFSTASKDASDLSWFGGAQAEAVWAAAERAGASLCLHVFRWNRDAAIAAIVPLLGRYQVSLVLDHVGNPTSEEPAFGLRALDPLLPFERLFVKTSTINFEYIRKNAGDIAAFTAAVVARFGAGRVMWGSDVAQSTGTYEQFIADGVAAAATLSSTERAAVLGGTASEVYFRSRT